MTPTVKALFGTMGVVGLAGAVTAIVIGSRAKKTEEEIQGAIDAPPGSQPEVKVRLTHYYPWAAVTEAEKKMEGGTKDRKGRPLRTVEDFLAGDSDYVSLAGDWQLWPDGQKILFPWGDKTLVGRIVDTGGHFYGSKKMIRASGYEPIDVCVFDKNNKPPKNLVTVRVVVGDHFEKNRQKLPVFASMGVPPTAVGTVCGFDILGTA